VKNSYLNGVLNFSVELGVIQKTKKKYIDKKNLQNKKRKKNIKKTPQILVAYVERKKAWFLALTFERQKRREDPIE